MFKYFNNEHVTGMNMLSIPTMLLASNRHVIELEGDVRVVSDEGDVVVATIVDSASCLRDPLLIVTHVIVCNYLTIDLKKKHHQ